MDKQMEIAACLRELLRLYDLRFVLAKQEDESRNRGELEYPKELKYALSKYGHEKKAAWARARTLLT